VNFRTDIVVVFAVLVSVIIAFLVCRGTYRKATEWWEDTWEWVNRRRFAARLLEKAEKAPREALVKIALALALAPYDSPTHKTEDDAGLVRARARYLAAITSLSDEDLRRWIDERVGNTHSLFLKAALQSLDSTSSGSNAPTPKG
jgi:hypothetical protein